MSETIVDTNRDQIFKGQHGNEEFVCFFRHHWIVLIKEFLVLIFLIPLTIISILNFSRIQELIVNNQAARMVFGIAYIFLTFLFHRFFIKMLNYFVNIGIITDTRVIDQQRTIFFKDVSDSIDLSYIQNIEQLSEGILSSLFKFGDIKIFLASSITTKTFPSVPNVKFHYRCINRQKEQREKLLARQHGEIPGLPKAQEPLPSWTENESPKSI